MFFINVFGRSLHIYRLKHTLGGFSWDFSGLISWITLYHSDTRFLSDLQRKEGLQRWEQFAQYRMEYDEK